RRQTATVDIASLLKGSDSYESSVSPPQHHRAASVPPTVAATASAVPVGPPVYAAPRLEPGPGLGVPARRIMAPHAAESPAKKQSKWSAEEDALIIELRGNGMKWEDISKRLPGRSAISCRLHYQNYLERRSEWDEERKNKLARLYERFKPEMWAKVAEEMAIPWRAAEAMHWQLGENDMARRAGVVPFALSAVNLDSAQARGPPRGHSHSHSQGSLPRDMVGPTRGYGRTPTMPQARPIVTRKDSMPPHMPPHLEHGPGGYDYPPPGGPLAPIQSQSQQRPGMLPGLAELTTGVSPYSTPAYSIGIPSVSPAQSATASPGPFIPAMAYPPLEPAGSKRRRSPDLLQAEANRRRHLDPQPLERVMPRHMP
ncbi:hypothetical protein PG985_009139, partial [Apiospora marii]|uniref:uncharacterized protein n=1 Tax=Apiospora marii TaxID=335849 RepID=UPI0031315E56